MSRFRLSLYSFSDDILCSTVFFVCLFSLSSEFTADEIDDYDKVLAFLVSSEGQCRELWECANKFTWNASWLIDC